MQFFLVNTRSRYPWCTSMPTLCSDIQVFNAGSGKCNLERLASSRDRKWTGGVWYVFFLTPHPQNFFIFSLVVFSPNHCCFRWCRLRKFIRICTAPSGAINGFIWLFPTYLVLLFKTRKQILMCEFPLNFANILSLTWCFLYLHLCLGHLVWWQSVFKIYCTFGQQCVSKHCLFITNDKNTAHIHKGVGTKSAVGNLSTADHAMGAN